MLRAALALLLLTATGSAAPVPPSPKPVELTREQMAGAWEYSYGSLYDGRIWLFADGAYCAKHAQDAQTYYYGYWYVSANCLHLREWSGAGGCGTGYAYTFVATDYPYLVGQSGTGVRVGLRR